MNDPVLSTTSMAILNGLTLPPPQVLPLTGQQVAQDVLQIVNLRSHS